ncbi:class II fructose-bisphosphate aldolase [bacterium]|nr:MAG: class II fructose-bisphosphate aldolase [bacterium]
MRNMKLRKNNSKEILKKAQEKKFAVGAFNFSTLEQLRAIFEAANTLKSPIIVQTSPGETDFLGIDLTVGAVKVFRKRYNVSAFLNLDHGKEINIIKQAINSGYDMVQFDGSRLSFEENLTKTKEVVDYAQCCGVLVEGELGYLRGSSNVYEESPFISQKDYTDPDQAEKFVKETQIDLLAISVGNIHGALKNKENNPPLDINRIQEINSKLKNTFLVLHGGSGTSEDELKQARSAGIVKININTDLRNAYTEALRAELKKNKEQIVPYKYLKEPINKLRKIVEYKIKLFGSNDKTIY